MSDPRLSHKGASNPGAKYTEETILTVRRLYSAGVRPREIEAQTGVRAAYIQQIVHGHAWPHLGGALPKQPSRAGGRNPRAKISPEDIEAILRSPENNTVLGRKYGVHHSTISAIRRGITWRKEDSMAPVKTPSPEDIAKRAPWGRLSRCEMCGKLNRPAQHSRAGTRHQVCYTCADPDENEKLAVEAATPFGAEEVTPAAQTKNKPPMPAPATGPKFVALDGTLKPSVISYAEFRYMPCDDCEKRATHGYGIGTTREARCDKHRLWDPEIGPDPQHQDTPWMVNPEVKEPPTWAYVIRLEDDRDKAHGKIAALTTAIAGLEVKIKAQEKKIVDLTVTPLPALSTEIHANFDIETPPTKQGIIEAIRLAGKRMGDMGEDIRKAQIRADHQAGAVEDLQEKLRNAEERAAGQVEVAIADKKVEIRRYQGLEHALRVRLKDQEHVFRRDMGKVEDMLHGMVLPQVADSQTMIEGIHKAIGYLGAVCE